MAPVKPPFQFSRPRYRYCYRSCSCAIHVPSPKSSCSLTVDSYSHVVRFSSHHLLFSHLLPHFKSRPVVGRRWLLFFDWIRIALPSLPRVAIERCFPALWIAAVGCGSGSSEECPARLASGSLDVCHYNLHRLPLPPSLPPGRSPRFYCLNC